MTENAYRAPQTQSNRSPMRSILIFIKTAVREICVRWIVEPLVGPSFASPEQDLQHKMAAQEKRLERARRENEIMKKELEQAEMPPALEKPAGNVNKTV